MLLGHAQCLAAAPTISLLVVDSRWASTSDAYHWARVFGLDLASHEEAADLLLWIDFLHSLYSGGLAPGTTAEQWRRAWIARQRVVNRYSH